MPCPTRSWIKSLWTLFEIGYRRTLGNGKGSFNLNAFHYKYDDVFARIGVSATPELFTATPFLNVQGTYDNLLEGDATGFEAFLDWGIQ